MSCVGLPFVDWSRFYILLLKKDCLKCVPSTQIDFSRGGPYFPVKILVQGIQISRTKIPVAGLIDKLKSMEGQELSSFLCGKKLLVVLQCIFRCDFLSSGILQWFQILKTIPVPACLVTVMIWCNCYRA